MKEWDDGPLQRSLIPSKQDLSHPERSSTTGTFCLHSGQGNCPPWPSFALAKTCMLSSLSGHLMVAWLYACLLFLLARSSVSPSTSMLLLWSCPQNASLRLFSPLSLQYFRDKREYKHARQQEQMTSRSS